MKTQAIISTLSLFLSLSAWAQGPNNSGEYYRAADGKKGEALKTALHSIIKEPKVVSYGGLKEAYKKTDVRPDGYLRDWYSNITKFVPGSNFGSYKKEGDAYNREHSIPQSWFNEATPMKSDIVHVVPTDGYINNMRSSDPFGEVNTSASNYKHSEGHYSKSGSARSGLGYSGVVFEPNDEIKGDIARIYFYMATCYQDRILSWTSGTGGSVIGGTTYQPFKQWVVDMMMRWAKQDPVDEVEKARNNAVYQVQKNRNPFVDYPGLEDYVWGAKKDEPFSYTDYQGAADYVYAPVFTPNGGTFTDQVEVSISSATADATIYYTTNGSDASEQSTPYTAPLTLTNTTTLKAIAVKGDTRSLQTTATFTVRKGGDEPVIEPQNSEIVLNNAFFNTTQNGSMQKTETADLTGSKDGISVIYALGTGSYRYINDTHLRLYGGNTLTFSTTGSSFSQISFELVESSTKTLSASTGTVNGLVWTGNASQVVFSVDGGNGHLKMKKATVARSGADGIERLSTTEGRQPATTVFDLQGRRVQQPVRGLYIHQGRKYMVR